MMRTDSWVEQSSQIHLCLELTCCTDSVTAILRTVKSWKLARLRLCSREHSKDIDRRLTATLDSELG